MLFELSVLEGDHTADAVSSLESMDSGACGIPHHRRWLGIPLSQCPKSRQDASTQCVHSGSPRLKLGIDAAVERGFMTLPQANTLKDLLDQLKWGPAWRVDMLAIALSNQITLNLLDTKPTDIDHLQNLVGLPRDLFPVEKLTADDAVRIVTQRQEQTMQMREDLRQLLLSLLRQGDDDDIRESSRLMVDSFIARFTDELCNGSSYSSLQT